MESAGYSYEVAGRDSMDSGTLVFGRMTGWLMVIALLAKVLGRVLAVPHTYSELYYHFVWATRDREPLISDDMGVHLYRFLRHKCEELGTKVHALNGVSDHVHLVASVPPRLALSEFMHDLKGASSHFINENLTVLETRLYWQQGYGVLTFAKRELPWMVSYVDGQKARHRDRQLSSQLERISED